MDLLGDMEELALEAFNEKFDKLTCDQDTYGDVLEMMMLVIHSEKAQKTVRDKYLEMKGFELNDLGEEGREFFKQVVIEMK